MTVSPPCHQDELRTDTRHERGTLLLKVDPTWAVTFLERPLNAEGCDNNYCHEPDCWPRGPKGEKQQMYYQDGSARTKIHVDTVGLKCPIRKDYVDTTHGMVLRHRLMVTDPIEDNTVADLFLDASCDSKPYCNGEHMVSSGSQRGWVHLQRLRLSGTNQKYDAHLQAFVKNLHRPMTIPGPPPRTVFDTTGLWGSCLYYRHSWWTPPACTKLVIEPPTIQWIPDDFPDETHCLKSGVTSSLCSSPHGAADRHLVSQCGGTCYHFQQEAKTLPHSRIDGRLARPQDDSPKNPVECKTKDGEACWTQKWQWGNSNPSYQQRAGISTTKSDNTIVLIRSETRTGDRRYCLTASAVENGGSVDVAPCYITGNSNEIAGTEFQLWERNGDNIRLLHHPQFCLNLHLYAMGEGAIVTLWSCSSHNSQKWANNGV